jgi:hypothetical protein
VTSTEPRHTPLVRSSKEVSMPLSKPLSTAEVHRVAHALRLLRGITARIEASTSDEVRYGRWWPRRMKVERWLAQMIPVATTPLGSDPV